MSARLLLATAGIATALVTSACSGAGQGDLHDTIEQVSPTTSQSTGTSAATDGGAGAPQPTVGNAGRPADQFKTSAQLAPPSPRCFGSGRHHRHRRHGADRARGPA